MEHVIVSRMWLDRNVIVARMIIMASVRDKVAMLAIVVLRPIVRSAMTLRANVCVNRVPLDDNAINVCQAIGI